LKKTMAAVIILLQVIPLFSMDYNRNQKIINSILKEDRSKKTAIIPKETAEKSETAVKDDKKKEEEPLKPVMQGRNELLLKNGIQFFYSGLYGESLKSFRELINTHGQSPYTDSSRVWIGKILIRQYDYPAAIKELQSIDPRSGEYPAALYYTAESHYLNGSYIEAIEFYQKMAYQFPLHDLADNALLKTGQLYLRTGKGGEALKSMVNLIKMYGDRETVDDAYFLLGKIFISDPELKDLETARTIYKIFLDRVAAGKPWFKDSPLTARVKGELRHLEKNYFKITN